VSADACLNLAVDLRTLLYILFPDAHVIFLNSPFVLGFCRFSFLTFVLTVCVFVTDCGESTQC